MRCARFAVLSAVLVFAFAASAFASPAGWTVTQLTSSAAAQLRPQVSGDRVVWYDTSNNSVRTWKSGEATQQVSADGDTILGNPAVSGDSIAWLASRPSVGHFYYVWTPSSGAATAATEYVFDNADQDSPKISEDRIAWVDRPEGETVSHVYTWKIGESAPTTISTNNYSIYDPIALSGNRVAWDCSVDGHANDIFTRDMNAGDQVVVASHAGNYESAYSPDVSGNRVVWVDDVGSMAVRTWSSDGTSMTVGPLADGDLDPHVSGDRLVWRAPDAGGVAQVVTWKVGDSAVTTLTSGGTDYTFHRFQQVSGDRVVWVELDGAYHRVMTWTPASGVTTLSGDYDAGYVPGLTPQVDGDRVVWTGYVNGVAQIFTAVLGTEQTPLTATSLAKPTVSPSKPKKNATAKFSTTLSPGAAGVVGGRVTLALYHQETKTVRKKIGGTWRKVKVKYWRLRKSVKMTRVSSAARYSASAKLAYKGSWRATVTGVVPSGYTAPASKTLSFAVK